MPPGIGADSLLERALHEATGQATRPDRVVAIGEGIGVTARVEVGRQRFAAKWYRHAEGAAMVAAEARGLARLGRAESGLVVPRVVATASGPRGTLLLIEWLEQGAATTAVARRLGEGVARLHQQLGARYGLGEDNFLGPTPQRNDWDERWPRFYAERRLGPLAERLVETGRLRGTRARRLERLMGRLPDLLPAEPPPSLLHGDLWAGNWLALADGRAALIDPAPSFGDREAELAMTHLFGGFPAPFYEAYHASWPLPPGEAERRPLYALYHLLNHLLIFGESYGARVDGVLERYGA